MRALPRSCRIFPAITVRRWPWRAIARQGKAKMLLFTHIVPRMPTRLLHPYFLRGVAEAYSGDVVMGEDGMQVSLPARSDAIERADLL